MERRVCGIWVVLAAGAQAVLAQTPASRLNHASLARQIQAMVVEPAVARAHWGVIVTEMDGSRIVAMNESQMFRPASNAKLFTTAAALALLGGGTTFETRVVAKGNLSDSGALVGDLVIVGDGDANLSDRTLPYAMPNHDQRTAEPISSMKILESMADDVTKSGLKTIDGDIVGDDSLFPYEPYATDWTIDDAVWGYGAPVSALSINDNQIELTIKPGALAGATPAVEIDPSVPYYSIDMSDLRTAPAKSGSHVQISRQTGSKTLRLSGSIAVDVVPDEEEVAIEAPAEYAAIAFKAMLERRGISITGVARASHSAPAESGEFLTKMREPISELKVGEHLGYGRGRSLTFYGCDHCDAKTLPMERVLASRQSVEVGEDVVVTNKVSQNLHAELLLHQLAAVLGRDGSTVQGARVELQFLLNIGVDKDDFVFYDGSGLSDKDLVTPRAIVKLLKFAATQPWFAQYKASLPVGGVDGSLQHRFAEAPLKGHVFAKTGSLGESRALSGYLECASGRTVIFSVMVDNHAPGSNADREVMDRIVAAIAAAE